MKAARVFMVSMLLGLAPFPAAAQAPESRPFAWDVARAVLIDPTTYAPALISPEAIRQDWKTSQILFANGWVEQNPPYTVSGRANDLPVSYEAGTRRIRGAALSVPRTSADVRHRAICARHRQQPAQVRENPR